MQKIARRKVAEYVAGEIHAKGNVAKLAKQLAAYLVEHNQAGNNDVELLVRDVESVLESKYSTIAVKVRSARPLDAATRKNICESVKNQTSAKSVVIVDEQIDPSLVGGVIIETPSSIFDSSLQTKLQQLAAITKE